MLSAKKKKLASALFDIGAIKFGAFRLKLHEKNPDAPLSPIYIDLRVLRSFPEVLGLAVGVYEDLIQGLTFDCYADVPTAATPIVAVLAYKTQVPMITPRNDEKTHGVQNTVDGVFHTGNVALLIDDLITSAASKLEAISTLARNGVEVHDVVVLVDREQGGVEELHRRGYECRVAFKLTELLSFYLEIGRITDSEHQETVRYLKNPR